MNNHDTAPAIPLFDLRFGKRERDAVDRVLREGWLSQGPLVENLETEFSTLFGGGHSVALSSGTAALHLALVLSGIGPGDEVIVPSLTFAATVNAVSLTGAVPVFADILGPDRPFLGTETILPLLTQQTKAIILVHYAGIPCPTEELRRLAKQRGLVLIEDAAHGPGQDANGQWLGTRGDFGCFSFYSNKVLACGEGGLLWCRRRNDAERARRLRSHGMQTARKQTGKVPSVGYDVLEPGWNYRLDELHAALLLSQLPSLPKNLERRQALCRRYVEGLYSLERLTLPMAEIHQGGFHLFPILTNSRRERDTLRKELGVRGIATGIHYQPVHTFHAYRNETRLPITEDYARQEITLPLFPHLSFNQVDHICQTIASVLSKRRS